MGQLQKSVADPKKKATSGLTDHSQNKDDMDKRFKLTSKQWEAWGNLKKAFNDCFNEGIDFLLCDYTNLTAINGEEIGNYVCEEDIDDTNTDVRADLDGLPCLSLDYCFQPSSNEFGIKLKEGHK